MSVESECLQIFDQAIRESGSCCDLEHDEPNDLVSLASPCKRFRRTSGPWYIATLVFIGSWRLHNLLIQSYARASAMRELVPREQDITASGSQLEKFIAITLFDVVHAFEGQVTAKQPIRFGYVCISLVFVQSNCLSITA